MTKETGHENTLLAPDADIDEEECLKRNYQKTAQKTPFWKYYNIYF